MKQVRCLYCGFFIQWLFGKDVQKSMPGNGRGFRRKTSKFWEIWPMPPKIESPMNVVYVDGICAAMRIPEHGKH